MTIYRRIKDYCDRRGHNHYHLERVALPSDEPTEDDLRGEDREAIEAYLGYEAFIRKDITDKLRQERQNH